MGAVIIYRIIYTKMHQNFWVFSRTYPFSNMFYPIFKCGSNIYMHYVLVVFCMSGKLWFVLDPESPAMFQFDEHTFQARFSSPRPVAKPIGEAMMDLFLSDTWLPRCQSWAMFKTGVINIPSSPSFFSSCCCCYCCCLSTTVDIIIYCLYMIPIMLFVLFKPIIQLWSHRFLCKFH